LTLTLQSGQLSGHDKILAGAVSQVRGHALMVQISPALSQFPRIIADHHYLSFLRNIADEHSLGFLRNIAD
jgi:hypothetical protein